MCSIQSIYYSPAMHSWPSSVDSPRFDWTNGYTTKRKPYKGKIRIYLDILKNGRGAYWVMDWLFTLVDTRIIYLTLCQWTGILTMAVITSKLRDWLSDDIVQHLFWKIKFWAPNHDSIGRWDKPEIKIKIKIDTVFESVWRLTIFDLFKGLSCNKLFFSQIGDVRCDLLKVLNRY